MKIFIQTYFSFLICILLCFTSLENAFCYAREGDYLNKNMSLFVGNKEFIAQENRVLDKANNNGNSSNASSFNVLDFGAKGDGKTDETQAFLKAWNATCTTNGGLMYVPSPFTFQLQPLTFEGASCQPNVVVQVDGNVIATERKKWPRIDQFQWILFSNLTGGLTIKGNGMFDGRGQSWWMVSDVRPHALRIVSSVNVVVTGIKIQNSPRIHIYFDFCQHVQVFGLTVLSPAESLNTDGIHIANVQDARIYNNTVACGDDCISIQTGCSGVIIHDMICGPSHGISIGGLGPPNDTTATVSSVNVYDSSISNSLFGLRIKTWKDAMGFVNNVTYNNINMEDVKIAIRINQYYCDGCPITDDTSALSINGVTYTGIRGTYTDTPVSLLCSDVQPCMNLTFGDINLVPSATNTKPINCCNAYGTLLMNITPPLDNCVRSGGKVTPQVCPRN